VLAAVLGAATALAVSAGIGAAAPRASSAPPSNTSPPSVGGQAQAGQTLVANRGSWQDADSYSYQWQRCDSNGNGCGDIGGATGSSYNMVSADVGHRLRVIVTAKNHDGSSSAASSPSSVVAGGGPTLRTHPTIGGAIAVGKTLGAWHGNWNHRGAIGYAYQWQQCDDHGNGCNNIGGATGQKYQVTSADVGHTLVVVVTATDTDGSGSAASSPTSVVPAPPNPDRPSNASLPAISGNPQVGQKLTVSSGNWHGAQPMRLIFEWQRCDASGSVCGDIAGARSQAYTVTSADAGHRLRVAVTAENKAGAAAVVTNDTDVVSVPGPAGSFKLPTGETSIPVTSVAPPARLVISQVQFSPARIHSRSEPLVGRFRVTDTRGYVVRDALVYAVGIPFNRVSVPAEAATDSTGWATITYQVLPGMPIQRGYRLTFFVRARKGGDNILAGVSSRRLVSVGVSP
jgi:hypothetical protein